MGFVPKFALSLLAGCACLSMAGAAFARQHPLHKAANPPVAAEHAAPAPPPAPLTLEQMPAVPPHVSYSHGELTIIAQNSTLGDILRAVREQTGAAIDVPANATERVVGQMGPGSPRDVLAQLLNGSRFNYVILGSATDPAKLQQVVLSPRPAGPPENTAAPPASLAFTPPPAPQPVVNPSSFGQPPSDNDNDAGSDNENDNGDASEPQPPTQAPVRSPEQLLQELQHQQQLQQQQGQPQPGTSSPHEK